MVKLLSSYEYPVVSSHRDACGWPVDALMRFRSYPRAIATPIAVLKAAVISAEYLACTGAMLCMG